MTSDLKSEHILVQVREKLNKDKIKLWQQPYYDETNGVGTEQEKALELLRDQIAEQLNMDKEQCMSTLRDLQNHALDRLKCNKVFKETGVASLSVKVSGDAPRVLTLSIPLTAEASELTQLVSNEVGVPKERIKVISQGRVLRLPESLVSQGVKNAMQLMAVIMADGDKLQATEKRLKTLESTKEDVKLLAGRSNVNDEYYLQIENQSGEAMDLPYHERKALVTAMALHEKGRAALKREDYSLALVLFLEADKEYSECTSKLLDAVDNYALLHLDIAWCYLCLRNPAQIPDADRRLTLCEQSFHKSYGANLERLLVLKGCTGNERALFLRLHLLQGVVLFHQNKRSEAKQLLEQAQAELSGLKINDDSLCMLLELGFSNKEARLALQATRGNVEAAEEFLHRRRSEQDLTRERNRLQLKNEKERIKLGMCADGRQLCEPSLVQQLERMGFDRQLSIAALKQSNNNVSEAVTLIQEQPHLLASGSSGHVPQGALDELMRIGCDPAVAREALAKFPDMVNTFRNLSTGAGVSEACSNLGLGPALKIIEDISKKRKAKEIEEKEAFERISQDLLDHDLKDDHLNSNLGQEEQFLMEYLSLLN